MLSVPPAVSLNLKDLHGYVESCLARFPSPGLSVAVCKDGKIVWKGGFGYSRINEQVKTTPETTFWVASLTKSFTSALILKLMEQGKIKEQEPIGQVVPGLPKKWQGITIYELLTHTSGIPNWTVYPGFGAQMDQTISLESAFDKLGKMKLDFTPGTKYQYSNTNYMVLADAVQTLTGKSFIKNLQEQIFSPLQLNSMGIMQDPSSRNQAAQGYLWDNGSFTEAPRIDASQALGAGDLQGTASDLALWIYQFWNGSVVGKKLLKRAGQPARFKGGTYPYGFGWVLMNSGKHRVMGHEGQINGFTSEILDVPDLGLSVSLLSNNADFNAQGMALMILHHIDSSLESPPIHDPTPEETERIKVFMAGLDRGYVDKDFCTPGMQSILTKSMTARTMTGITIEMISEMKLTLFDKKSNKRVYVLSGKDANFKLIVYENKLGHLTGLMVHPD